MVKNQTQRKCVRKRLGLLILEIQMASQSACIKADENEMRQIAYNNDPVVEGIFFFLLSFLVIVQK